MKCARCSRWPVKVILIISLFLGGSLNSLNAHADVGLSLSTGIGAAHIVPWRLGIQKTFDKHWNVDSTWPVGGFWEASFCNMNGRAASKPGSHSQLNALALAGVFRFERSHETMIGWPYVELGIGGSWLSQKEIGGRDLGMHFQFEDRFGIGFRFGPNQEYDIGYKAIHFSNAYIGNCNHGINLHVISFGYWFK